MAAANPALQRFTRDALQYVLWRCATSRETQSQGKPTKKKRTTKGGKSTEVAVVESGEAADDERLAELEESMATMKKSSSKYKEAQKGLKNLRKEAKKAKQPDNEAPAETRTGADGEEDIHQPVPSAERRALLTALCEAFTNCQAAQARAIDSAYGRLSGRDLGLRDQVVALVDAHKQLALDQAMLRLRPDLLEDRAARSPHVQSAWLTAVGEQLGLPGTAAAAMDQHADPPPSAKDKALIEATVRDCFDVRDVTSGLVADVNQRGTETERYISHKALVEWAAPGNTEANSGFDSHSIFYDSDHAGAYHGSEPPEGTEFEPFLSLAVAMDILLRVFE